jgi:hypothetical protein
MFTSVNPVRSEPFHGSFIVTSNTFNEVNLESDINLGPPETSRLIGEGEGGGLPIGAVIGIVLGGVTLLGIAGVIIFMVLRQREPRTPPIPVMPPEVFSDDTHVLSQENNLSVSDIFEDDVIEGAVVMLM